MTDYRPPDFHFLTPDSEIEARTRKLARALGDRGLDAALILQPVDLYYFSGTAQDAHLLIPADAPPLLLVRRDADRAAAESPLETRPLAGLSRLPGLVADRLGREPRAVGLEMDVLTAALYQKYASLWPQAELADVSRDIMNIRAVKSEYELDWMRRAGRAAARVYARAAEVLKPGLTEIDAAGRMSVEAYRLGHQNHLPMRGFGQVMYTWHVISGASGSVPSRIDAAFGGYGVSPAFPVGASEKVMEAGEGVLIDFGFCLHGYQVDQTRMFGLGGAPDIIVEACRALAEIERRMLEVIRPGVAASAVFGAAVDAARDTGFGDNFLGPPERKVGFAGHGVGLEINEPPIFAPGFDSPLLENMTPALELKMVFPGVGAAGLENTVAVKPEGPEKLTPAAEGLIMV